MEDSEEEEEAFVEEEDGVTDLSSVIIVGYLDITKEISHTCIVRVHTVLQLIILLRTGHN